MQCEKCYGDGGSKPIKFCSASEQYLCFVCHPFYPSEDSNHFALAHTRQFKSGRKISHAREKSIKDKVKCRDDNSTVLSRSTGKEYAGWIGA